MIAGLTLFPQQIRPVPTDASVWEWAPMSIETNQIVDSFFVRHHKFPSDVLISKYTFYANKNCRRINVGQWKKWHSVKSFWFILIMTIFPLRHVTHKMQAPVVKISWLNIGWFLPVSAR